MKLTPFPQARLQLTRKQRTLPSGSSARGTAITRPIKNTRCSCRTRKASVNLHRTKKIGLYFRGVSSISFDTLDSVKVVDNALQTILAQKILLIVSILNHG